MSEVIGRWVNKKLRCDYCHNPRDAVYIVSSGDCTGTFCSRLHFEMARAAKAEKELPSHET